MTGTIAPAQRSEARRADSGVQTARWEPDSRSRPPEHRLKFSTPFEIGDSAETKTLDDLLPILAADSLGG